MTGPEPCVLAFEIALGLGQRIRAADGDPIRGAIVERGLEAHVGALEAVVVVADHAEIDRVAVGVQHASGRGVALGGVEVAVLAVDEVGTRRTLAAEGAHGTDGDLVGVGRSDVVADDETAAGNVDELQQVGVVDAAHRVEPGEDLRQGVLARGERLARQVEARSGVGPLNGGRRAGRGAGVRDRARDRRHVAAVGAVHQPAALAVGIPVHAEARAEGVVLGDRGAGGVLAVVLVVAHAEVEAQVVGQAPAVVDEQRIRLEAGTQAGREDRVVAEIASRRRQPG